MTWVNHCDQPITSNQFLLTALLWIITHVQSKLSIPHHLKGVLHPKHCVQVIILLPLVSCATSS